MKYIFESIIKTESIFLVIEEHFTDAREKEHVKAVIRDTIHHQLVDMILDELDAEQRTLFLIEIDDETKHQTWLEKLGAKIENFEEKLHLRAKESETEMLGLIEAFVLKS